MPRLGDRRGYMGGGSLQNKTAPVWSGYFFYSRPHRANPDVRTVSRYTKKGAIFDREALGHQTEASAQFLLIPL